MHFRAPHFAIFLAMLALTVASCFYATGSDTPAKNETRNIWAARDVPQSEVDELLAAWDRYLLSCGFEPEDLKTKKGFTNAQIEELEQGICTKLPNDLRALLKVILTDGKFFVDNLEILPPQYAIQEWLDHTSLSYGGLYFEELPTIEMPPRYDDDLYGNEDDLGPRCDFESFLLPLMGEHLDYIFVDMRNGLVIEEMDNDFGVMAQSLTELFNEIARLQEEGKIVARYYEREDGTETKETPILQSAMLEAYEK